MHNNTNYTFKKLCQLAVEGLQIDDKEVKSFGKGADVKNSDQRSHTVDTHKPSHTHLHTLKRKKKKEL